MKHLKVNDSAPVFSGTDQHGNTLSLSDFKGKKVALYFYPKDNTPGCTAQACSIRDHQSDLLSKGIAVVGVSADSVKSHSKFTEKFGLPFPLLADENHEILQQYGVWGPKKFMGREFDGIHRTTFLIDESQTIVGILDKPNTKAHAEEILSFFENAK
jgi:peroxiredoxin Q/BCP